MPRTDYHKDERVMRSRWDWFHPPPVLLSFSRVTKEPSLEAQKRKRKKQKKQKLEKKKRKKKKEKKPNCYRPGGQQHLGLKGQGSLVHLASSIRQKQTSTASAGGSKKDREARRESFFFSLLSTSCSSFSFSSSLSSPPHLGF
ncbi:uncharacterized protein ARB_06537 [Trichophyton benhamiae CBS 112371]|uniref:Uncharacterized protein n=1 Tax=Arthroderma benhamiae (strain ATCC MYA-4681 / CBS 112371) TaxID=663331 RepID=D4AQM8_ARTBC|nr:uncharacterized protein ARB_06537 [Trichophyton benhamiae CBS 112371]EFE34772.1 hypothetical protein ARB_06537 [Trichophyton benhamiae CBS 112371]